MAPLFLDPGLLRTRARALEGRSEPSDGAGGAETAWQEVRELSVHVEPVAVEARERFDQREATVTHRVICRSDARGVEEGASFRLGDAAADDPDSVHDPDESGRFLVCRCEEEADDAAHGAGQSARLAQRRLRVTIARALAQRRNVARAPAARQLPSTSRSLRQSRMRSIVSETAGEPGRPRMGQ